MIVTHETKVQKIHWLTDDVFEVLLDRVDLPFKPGMALSVVGPDGKTVRSFSLASGPDDDHFRLIIKHVPVGKLSPYLAELSAGDTISFRGPFGMFLVGKHKPFIYIATGTGITPLLSYMRAHPDEPPDLLLYGVRKFEDAVGYEELKNWCDTRLCLSREERDGCHAGRVTDLLGQVLREDEAHYYLCGLDTMLFQVSEWLNEREVPKDRVHMEVFFKDQLEAKRRREEMMRRLAERQAQQGS